MHLRQRFLGVRLGQDPFDMLVIQVRKVLVLLALVLVKLENVRVLLVLPKANVALLLR